HESGANQAALDWALCNQQQAGDTQQKTTEFIVPTGVSDASKIVNKGSSVSKNPEMIARKPVEPIIKRPAEVEESQDNGEQWLKTQATDNYTLQIIVLSKEQAAKDVLKKHPLMKDNLRYLKKKVGNGKERFVLIYGSFTSFALANKAKQSLPAEFRNSMARKMSALKNK
ncbi:MAG: SPOR domain-containing protein, partial [Methylococcaceae bacterium]